MQISNQGLIEIASHEGVCLDPYLDSVGVWTIGIGQTKFDGFDPRSAGHMTIEQAFDLFHRKIKDYTRQVDELGLRLEQHQYDALTSFCYNVGPGNLAKLCHGRSIEQIGDALMLYTKPPEITERRRKEQTLFKTGRYSNTNGKVLIFPVVDNKPAYRKGYYVDVRPFLSGAVPEPPTTPAKPAQPSITNPAKGSIGAFIASIFTALFRKK